MSQTPTTSAATPEVISENEPTLAAGGTRRDPVLITEQQVMFSTAVAASARRASTFRRLSDAIRRFGSAVQLPPPRREYPQRNSYFENARMAREMDRL